MKLVVLTGAGISAESGPAFRGNDGPGKTKRSKTSRRRKAITATARKSAGLFTTNSARSSPDEAERGAYALAELEKANSAMNSCS